MTTPVSGKCVFCRIIDGEEPAEMVRRWNDAIAFVPLGPVTAGHVLVVPKDHVWDATESPYITGRVFARAAEIAPKPCNLITSAGREATQSVFHLHVHVIPRRENDGLALPWYSGKSSKKTPQREPKVAGIPDDAAAEFTRSRAEGRDTVESAARALIPGLRL